MWSRKRKIYYLMYRLIAAKLPESYHCSFAKKLRTSLARQVVAYMGHNVNIEKGARFSPESSIGSRSGIGVNCEIHGQVTIGDNVMMGPEVVVYTVGHKHERTDIPMIDQGNTASKRVYIEDDVWIGRRAIIMPGVHIGKGSIIGAGAVVTKDIPSYSIAAGVPARIVKSRMKQEEK